MKFTEDAIQYGLCMGLNLVAWNFPIKENLKSMIDDSGLYHYLSYYNYKI